MASPLVGVEPAPLTQTIPYSRTRIFYDCEFRENGRTIDLISIGMVAEDGREFYAVNRHAGWQRICADPWLAENVLPGLPGEFLTSASGVEPGRYSAVYPLPVLGVDQRFWAPDLDDPAYHARWEISFLVAEFILSSPNPELWAWYGAFDHVTLAWLWGPMVALPKGVPMLTCDLKQEALRQGNPALPEQSEGVHNALADARHNVVRARALGLVS